MLEGTPGRVLTNKTAGGTERYNTYAEYIDAVDGYDLTLTIDATIQSYLEKTLEEGIKKYDIQDGAFGIVMNPKTGATTQRSLTACSCLRWTRTPAPSMKS